MQTSIYQSTGEEHIDVDNYIVFVEDVVFVIWHWEDR